MESLYKTKLCSKQFCTKDGIVTSDTQQESEKGEKVVVPCCSLAPQSVTLLAKKSKPCQYFKAHFHLYTLGNFRRSQLHFKPLTLFGVDHLNLFFLLTSFSTILTTMCWTNNGTAARDCLHATAYTRLPTCNCLHVIGNQRVHLVFNQT